MILEHSEHSGIIDKAGEARRKTEEDETEGQDGSVCRLDPKLGAPLLLFLLVEQLAEVHLSGELRHCREAVPSGSGTRDRF